jgi:hypothetical protein
MEEIMTRNGQRLIDAGFQVTHEVNQWGSGRGKWFEVVTPDGTEALVAVQNPSCWHCFYRFEGTASSTDPARCHEGGLGDAIGTDAQMRGYRRLVLNSPERLMREYDGLYRASSQVYNAAC